MATITLSTEQEQAVAAITKWYKGGAFTKPVFVVAGLAGSGKTTMVNYFIEHAGINQEHVRFLSYTGKASLVLRQAGCPAETIHHLIYQPRLQTYRCQVTGLKKQRVVGFDLKHELDKEIYLLVVDEVSMVSRRVLNDLLSFGVKVLALGDPAQLPPPHGDQNGLLNKPDVFLQEVHRQAADNPIIRLAHMARHTGTVPFGNFGKALVVPKHKFDWDQLAEVDQVICGLNNTRRDLNKLIRDMNGYTAQLPEEGEKLICLKNNWEEDVAGLPLVNGMTGVMVSRYKQINTLGRTFYINFRPDGADRDDVFCALETNLDYFMPLPGYTPNTDGKMNHFDFGHAITCHKAQGSGFRRVVYFHEPFGDARQRQQLLYTGFTRAIEEIIAVM